jgi:hypothetical protein
VAIGHFVWLALSTAEWKVDNRKLTTASGKICGSAHSSSTNHHVSETSNSTPNTGSLQPSIANQNKFFVRIFSWPLCGCHVVIMQLEKKSEHHYFPRFAVLVLFALIEFWLREYRYTWRNVLHNSISNTRVAWKRIVDSWQDSPLRASFKSRRASLALFNPCHLEHSPTPPSTNFQQDNV